jgi:glutaredoxin 3
VTAPVVMYTTGFCPYCIRARRFFDQRGVQYRDIRVDGDPGLRQKMQEMSGRRTVPQIWIGDVHVGGFDDLWALDRANQLDDLLNRPSGA